VQAGTSVVRFRLSPFPQKVILVPQTALTAAPALIIELNDGMWLIKQPGALGEPGVIRGYLFRVEAADGIRYLARLPHLYPTQGARLGEFWQWERAVAAVLAVAD